MNKKTKLLITISWTIKTTLILPLMPRDKILWAKKVHLKNWETRINRQSKVMSSMFSKSITLNRLQTWISSYLTSTKIRLKIWHKFQTSLNSNKWILSNNSSCLKIWVAWITIKDCIRTKTLSQRWFKMFKINPLTKFRRCFKIRISRTLQSINHSIPMLRWCRSIKI